MLSALYVNVIQKQKEAIEKLQLGLQNQIMQLKNELQLREKRLQETMVEKNKLNEQLQNFEYELQNKLLSSFLKQEEMQNALTEQSKLASAHAEEKKILVEDNSDCYRNVKVYNHK